jgi:integrase
VLQGFIGWLTDRPGRRGRLSDRSIRNALTPLRRCLDAAAGEGLIDSDLMRSLVLPARRGGRRWAVSERRFLTRVQLGQLLTDIPPAYQPLYVLLASTGLRISEAIALRWCDLDLDSSPPRLWVRRAIVRGVVLIEERTSSLRLQRWMGHHAAAYTLQTYGHLIDDELGKALELEDLGVHERER